MALADVTLSPDTRSPSTPWASGDSTPNSQRDRSGNSHSLGISEVLGHGRDGEPRWIVVDARNAVQAGAIGRRAAADARRCGFVAMAVDMYLRLCDVLREDLSERTLLLIGGFAAGLPAARAAFVEASARAPRPHVLLTFRLTTAGTGQACVAREPRAAYGVVRARPTAAAAGPDVTRFTEHINRAEAFVLAGRHAAAERLLRETAGALDRRRAFGLSSTARIALGRLLVERGRPGDADGHFDDAARHAGMAGDDDAAFAARIWQAAARCDCERFTDAESLCRAGARCRIALGGPALLGRSGARSSASVAGARWRRDRCSIAARRRGAPRTRDIDVRIRGRRSGAGAARGWTRVRGGAARHPGGRVRRRVGGTAGACDCSLCSAACADDGWRPGVGTGIV